jgi:hypothetical protein
MASLINLQTNFASCINAGLIKSLNILKAEFAEDQLLLKKMKILGRKKCTKY